MIDFPSNPSDGQFHTEDGTTWQFNEADDPGTSEGSWAIAVNGFATEITESTADWIVVGDKLWQGGSQSPDGSGNTTTIVFPQPFKEGTLPRFSGFPNSPGSRTLGRDNVSNTGVTFLGFNQDNSPAGQGVTWMAFGEAPDELKKPKEVGIGGGDIINQIYPVGHIYITNSAINPGILFPGTEWEQVAEGRAIVGVGDNGQTEWTLGQERGSETHTLTEAQMPRHRHIVDPPNTGTTTNGNHAHTQYVGNIQSVDGGGGVQVSGNPQVFGWGPSRATTTNGNHSHTVNIGAFWSGYTGSGNAHNNIQPSIAYYMWERIA